MRSDSDRHRMRMRTAPAMLAFAPAIDSRPLTNAAMQQNAFLQCLYTVRYKLHAITHDARALYIYIYANMVQLISVLCSRATEWPVGLLV